MATLPISADLKVLTATFTFATGSPLDFGTLVSGDDIIDSEIDITTVFDDAATLISLGQVSSPGNIFSTADLDPTKLGTYHNGMNFLVSGSDSICLQILPGTSTQGAGRVTLTVRRA